MYATLAGFLTRLTANISPNTRYLPIPSPDYERLVTNLKDGEYSFLEIRAGSAIEVVKVFNACGKITIERGAEQTRALNFNCGTGVSFILTVSGVRATRCQMESCK